MFWVAISLYFTVTKARRIKMSDIIIFLLSGCIGFVFGFTLSCVMSASKNADEQAQKRIEERENKK